MHKKQTIQDIARLAGVSKATVSRVLNRNPSVAPDLRERVLRVVQEQGFIPNVTATGLASGRTRLIGVLAPPLTWPAIPEILRGIAEYIESTAYEIVLYSIGFKRNHTDVLDNILAMRMVSGLLAILPGELVPHLTRQFQQGLPLVMIDDQEKPGSTPWVGIDNVQGAYIATRHLLDLGHRRIAHIAGPSTYYCAHERYQGYYQALQEAGIAPSPELLFQGQFEVASGRQCAATLFARNRNTWPTAIFAGNDQMAYGVLEVAEQQGIQIPDDVAVIGFDDNLLSAHMRPPLSTIRQPFSAIGQKAIEMLLTIIDPEHNVGEEWRDMYKQAKPVNTSDDSIAPSYRVQLPTNLVVRVSTGAPRSILSGQ